MDEELSENIPETAETQAVVTQEAEAKTEVGEASTDYEALYMSEKARNEQLQKVVADKDKAIKKYKPVALGKRAADDWSDDEDDTSLNAEKVQAMIADGVAQALAASELAESNKRLEEINQNVLRENKELRLASQNRPTSVAVGAGQDTSKPSAPAEILPPDMKAKYTADMKKEGKTDEQIEKFFENVRKNYRG